MKKHIEIRINGIVQGVGFRPFIYQAALSHNICGSVINDTEGVLIHAEADEKNIEHFLRDIQDRHPVLAIITSLKKLDRPLQNFASFIIDKSKKTGKKSAFYSPDIALCDECRSEYFNEQDRRFGYPFITCINCGPRFSIITDVPYDRHNTSMNSFQMCAHCHAEYNDPMNRRHHTQPNACPQCGPHLELLDNAGMNIETGDLRIAQRTIELLREGNILAVKGIGGYHLAVDAANDQAIARLRQRKNRPFKPFALMYGTIEAVQAGYYVTPVEKELLLSKERPIVLLKEKHPGISTLVAPGLTFQGVMLPYTPFHYSLFAIDPDIVLIMTSANISDEPIVYQDGEAVRRLKHIADYYVTYNREIVVQSDDSVLFVENEQPFFVRRSRGYVPAPFPAEQTGEEIIALGGDLKNSFALARDDYTIMGHYLGDMADVLTYNTLQKTMAHFIRVFDLKPGVVVSDMHPSYFTTSYADEFPGIEKIRVQHHHAHIASVMEDQGLRDTVIGVAFDGTGYGADGKLWGSEFLIADRGSFQRVGHFSYFPLPGGESAIKDVWKIGVSLLYQAFGKECGLLADDSLVNNIIEIIDKNINCPSTCSIGRLFDGIAAILGIAKTISSEAEAAILLEEEAYKSNKQLPTFEVGIDSGDDLVIVRTQDIIKHIVGLIQTGNKREDIAYAFHDTIADLTVKVLALLRKKHHIDTVVLSGGVFHNRLLLRLLLHRIPEAGFIIYTPRNVPFNDGCIALGQIAIARELIKK